ncbi:polysaccharide lyase [Pyxidicoccus parkwayensis]|uniref:polysaccharide lyase n=1 Tax=Pyxidicoccus parkwayensis TaxID=2813578 RepID=UPI001F507E88|nr:polysaccharide lyase [Pyxidicoccus parkwaysis]
MPHLLRHVALLSVLPTLAFAGVAWKGDFETGNTSQWTRSQAVANSRLQVVTDVVREGRYALKATVRQGDDPIGASGNRNELLYISHEKAGSTWFYKWSTMFPKNYPSSDTWQVFTQWHQEGCCGSPPLEFFVRGEEMNMRVGGASGTVLWQAPLDRGQWHDFVLEVKWSSNAKVGYVQLWHGGKLVVPKKYAATMFGSEFNYVKLGLYRDDTIRPEAYVYHDGFTMASSLADVMPPATPTPTPTPTPEPAPTPTPAPEQTPPVVTLPDPGPSTQTPTEEEPEAPTTQTPGTVSQPGLGVLPGDSTGSGSPTDSSGVPGSAPQGCGASATGTGGVPFLAATGLLAAFALFGRRRRQAHAAARASKR